MWCVLSHLIYTAVLYHYKLWYVTSYTLIIEFDYRIAGSSLNDHDLYIHGLTTNDNLSCMYEQINML